MLAEKKTYGVFHSFLIRFSTLCASLIPSNTRNALEMTDFFHQGLGWQVLGFEDEVCRVKGLKLFIVEV